MSSHAPAKHAVLATATGLLALAAACSNDTPGAPSDAGPEPGAVTYYGGVQPILDEHCVPCHSDAADRLAPFSLVGYAAAKKAVTDGYPITYAVQNRIMPPYLADNTGDCQTFANVHWLADEQIAKIAAWADGGAPEGDPQDAIAIEQPSPHLPNKQATVDMGVTFTPVADLSDQYRCFIVDPGLETDQFLIGHEVLPGEAQVVHHVLLFALNDANAETTAANLDANAAGPGYDCVGGVGASSNLLALWAPGAGAIQFPEGTGLPVKAGRKMVMQVHYNTLAAGALPDRTRIDLQLTPTVEKSALMYAIGDIDLNIPAGKADHLETALNTVPGGALVNATVWGVAPHMHERGVTLTVQHEPQSATSQCVLDVPRWDFHWQHFYRYTTPFTVKGGDGLRISCTYDASSAKADIHFGEGTQDEMCLAFFYVTL